jgi:hypothetical protein
MVSSREAVLLVFDFLGFLVLSNCPAGLGVPVGQGRFQDNVILSCSAKPSLEGCPSPMAVFCFSILRGSLRSHLRMTWLLRTT